MNRRNSNSEMAVEIAHERGYFVDDEGNVVSPHGGTLRTRIDNRGYRTFNIKVDGRSYPARVHRLAAYQKYGERIFDPDQQVRHLDENQLNNRPDNISVGTASDNAFDQKPKARVARAKHAARSLRVLSDSNVRSLLRDRDKGATLKELSAKYGVAKSTVSYIVNGKMSYSKGLRQ